MRFYVMLMMMRADDSYSPETVEGCTATELLACITADDYDACIAACSGEPENPDEPLVVKKGTLNVSATANNGAKVVLDGTSELDTINLKASEEINVEKVTLERYGYTKNEGIRVWLENTDGVVISNEKDLTKDEVTLTIKKDYRNAAETKDYVTVVYVSGANAEDAPYHTAGETLGFKVKDVISSAETLKISSYTPAEYTMAVYEGTDVKVIAKGKDTTYNYAEGEYYQVAKLRIEAQASAVSVKGFTLKAGDEIDATDDNEGRQANDIDFSRHIDKIEVLGDDGTSLRLSTADIKKGQIKVVFPAQTIEAKKNADFTVNVTLKDFEDFGEAIVLDVDSIDATEVKTSTRVGILNTSKLYGFVYAFQGSKIKVTNTNLGTVYAVAGSEDVVIAEGTIEVSEAINLNEFTIPFQQAGIESLELWLNGSVVDEGKIGNNGTTFTFSNAEIDKAGKIQFVADMNDELDVDTIAIANNTSFNKVLLAGNKDYIGRYDDSDKTIDSDNFIGSITFSTIKIQATKGALENTLTRKVEVIADGSSVRKTIFDGTYTAKKGDVYLNELTLTQGGDALGTDDYITLYVSIDGEEVVTLESTQAELNDTFRDVLVKDGKSVAVKVEADILAQAVTEDKTITYNLAIQGEDKDGKLAGEAEEDCVEISLVSQGSVSVVASSKDDVLLRSSNVSLAKFTVQSSLEGTKLSSFVIEGLIASELSDASCAEGFTLTDDGDACTADDETLENAYTAATDDDDASCAEGFTLTDDGDACTADDETLENAYAGGESLGTLSSQKLKVTVDGTTVDDDKIAFEDGVLTVNGLTNDVDDEGVVVEVSYRDLMPIGTFPIKLKTVNGKSATKTFNKYIVPALVKVTKQENLGDSTKYTFSVEKYESSYDIEDVTFGAGREIGSISNGDTEELANGNTLTFIETVTYTVVDGADSIEVSIPKATYKDYFKVGSEFLKIFKAKDN